MEGVQLNGDGASQSNQHFTGALRNASGNNTFTGTLTLNTNSTIGVDSGSSLTIGTSGFLPGPGTISGAVRLRQGTYRHAGSRLREHLFGYYDRKPGHFADSTFHRSGRHLGRHRGPRWGPIANLHANRRTERRHPGGRRRRQHQRRFLERRRCDHYAPTVPTAIPSAKRSMISGMVPAGYNGTYVITSG